MQESTKFGSLKLQKHEGRKSKVRWISKIEMWEEFAQVLDNSWDLQNKIKAIIDHLGKKIAEAKKNKDLEGEPEVRVMNGIHSAICVKFKDSLRAF